MDQRVIRVKLPYDRLCELGRMYTILMNRYKPAEIYQQLLHAHMKAMVKRLRIMAAKEQLQNTLSLNEAESLAFFLIWTNNEIDIPDATQWSAEITRSIVVHIDQSFHLVKAKKRIA